MKTKLTFLLALVMVFFAWPVMGQVNTLNKILADNGSSSIANGAFTNQMTWTNRTAGTFALALKYGLGQATAGGLNIAEIEKSTGGAVGQNLVTIQTIVGSTANPLQIKVGGTNALMVYNVHNQLLAGDAAGNPDVTYPEYSFLVANRYGFGLNLASSAPVIIRNGLEAMRWDSAGFKTGAGSVGSPVGSFTTATSSGYYSPFAGTIGFSGGGTLAAWATNSVFHTTNLWVNLVPYTWPTAQGGASTVLQNDGAGVLTWATASSGAAFSALTAATGNNTIQNGAFNQLWRFTDPGTGEINLELTGTNSTASGLLYVRGQMTHATAVQTRFTESLASTGGSGAQDLVRIDTVASSTATPLALYSRANRVIEVGYNANQLWAANGALGANTYSFLNLKTGGMTYDGTYAIFGYDSGDFLRFDNNSMLMFVSGGGQATLNNNGFGANDGGANAVQFNTGNGSNPGIEYNVRVKTTTTGSVSLSASISGGNSTGPGSIQNNSGASAGVTYNLPAAVIGNCYTFTVMDTDGITIDCNGTDTIQFNATATSAGGTIASATVGNTVTIICVDTGKWIVTSYVGTIAVTWTTT